jgi:hypothetical protein
MTTAPSARSVLLCSLPAPPPPTTHTPQHQPALPGVLLMNMLMSSVLFRAPPSHIQQHQPALPGALLMNMLTSFLASARLKPCSARQLYTGWVADTSHPTHSCTMTTPRCPASRASISPAHRVWYCKPLIGGSVGPGRVMHTMRPQQQQQQQQQQALKTRLHLQP